MSDYAINYHIHGWLEKIEDNLAQYKTEINNTTSEEDIYFITHQYHLMMLINRALAGTAVFAGAKPINPTNGG